MHKAFSREMNSFITQTLHAYIKTAISLKQLGVQSFTYHHCNLQKILLLGVLICKVFKKLTFKK